MSEGEEQEEDEEYMWMFKTLPFAARKRLESSVPIIRSDKDIPMLWNRTDKSVETVLDVFLKAKTAVHVLRAVEPNMRLGEQVANYLMRHQQLPQCPQEAKEQKKCVRVASKKQFGEILIRMMEKSGGALKS